MELPLLSTAFEVLKHVTFVSLSEEVCMQCHLGRVLSQTVFEFI